MAGRSAVAAVRAVAVEGDPGLTAAAAVFTATGRTPGRDRRGSSQRFCGSPVFGRKTRMHCYRFFISTETAGLKKKKIHLLVLAARTFWKQFRRFCCQKAFDAVDAGRRLPVILLKKKGS